jgi:hypothetical protein
MATQTVETKTVLPQYQEDFLKDLLATTKTVGSQPVSLPSAQVAQLTPAQRLAVQLGLGGVGAYAPMMQAGESTLSAGAGAIGQGIGTTLSGAPLLAQTVGAYDPRSYQQFMDPYMEDVIAQTQADIGRQGQIQAQNIGAQAVRGGAFGGSRQAVAEQELNRNIMEQQARTGAQMRSAGFQQAQQQAQNAFQNQMARQQSAAQLFGALGQGVGALGGQLTKAGLSQAALGESAQAASQRDINALMSLGGLEQAQAQAELDAGRVSALEQAYEPYQRIGFMSDIFRGVPTTQSTLQTTSAPDPSFLSQLAGIGMGIGGLSQAGLFGEGGIGGILGFRSGGIV